MRVLETAILISLFALSSGANAAVCLVADNGTGTADMPPHCEYTGDDWLIIDGLPPGATIELTPTLQHIGVVESPGGGLGGTTSESQAEMEFSVSGTGSLAGFNRTIFIPSVSVIDSGPRNPGDASQLFPTEMFAFQGSLFGDPDFVTLNIYAGSVFGLPSPGVTTMQRDGPPGSDFYVDSFFDITYQIEFQGAPGSVLDGLGGVTTGSSRMQTEVPQVPIPAAAWLFGSALIGLVGLKRKKA